MLEMETYMLKQSIASLSGLSGSNIILTARISKAGKLLGIKVLDHLIISTNGYYSFREMGVDMEEPILPPDED